jgi:hypothetical protein
MSRGRIQSDGSIVYPMRGDFPSPPLGYTSDPNDPYRLILDYLNCKYREIGQKFKCPSNQIKTRDFCHLLKLPINPAYCRDCQKREE